MEDAFQFLQSKKNGRIVNNNAPDEIVRKFLADAIFEHMTYDQLQIAVRAKGQTSWNLYKLLPSGMDFFVLLSSLAIFSSNVSQANYAAGNTFQDALADYRTAHGEQAISINLG
ncbi:KR domain-containing protein [Paraphoma chrysanthemicola]|nr:KR domain-containing protein [Paraphoma chrysanthemicola]